MVIVIPAHFAFLAITPSSAALFHIKVNIVIEIGKKNRIFNVVALLMMESNNNIIIVLLSTSRSINPSLIP